MWRIIWNFIINIIIVIFWSGVLLTERVWAKDQANPKKQTNRRENDRKIERSFDIPIWIGGFYRWDNIDYCKCFVSRSFLVAVRDFSRSEKIHSSSSAFFPKIFSGFFFQFKFDDFVIITVVMWWFTHFWKRSRISWQVIYFCMALIFPISLFAHSLNNSLSL